jgi:hypothetical protein
MAFGAQGRESDRDELARGLRDGNVAGLSTVDGETNQWCDRDDSPGSKLGINRSADKAPGKSEKGHNERGPERLADRGGNHGPP